MTLQSYQQSYQIAPIVLMGGIAGTGALPITSLLSASSFPQGITAPGAPNVPPSGYFGQFRVLPGHTLIENEVATYPFANQTTAANAVITDPLKVSLEMLVPASGPITLANKLSIITALKSSLDNHIAQGGWFNVATPSYIYQGCLLLNLVDASSDEEGSQVQVRFVWNFMQTLITAAAAQAAQNPLMSSVTNQTALSGSPPGSQGVANGINNPSSNITPGVVPAASGITGASVAPSGYVQHGVQYTNLGSVAPLSPSGGIQF